MKKSIYTLLLILIPWFCLAQNDNSAMGNMLQQLNKLIDEAEKARSADRYFISDLRDLVNQFDQPWQKRLLKETFADGDFTHSPGWKVLEGQFEVRKGLGLINRVQYSEPKYQQEESNKPSDPGAELAMALLGQLLKQPERPKKQVEKSSQISSPSKITLNQSISNSFSISVDIERLSEDGSFSFSTYQQNPNHSGYRLEFHPKDEYAVDLIRYSTRGNSIIESLRTLPQDIHAEMVLNWNRNSKGRMQVSIGDSVLIDTIDRGFRDPFDGLLYQVKQGEFSLKEVEIKVP